MKEKLLDTENEKLEGLTGVNDQESVDQSMSHKIVAWIKTQVTFVE